ncbi:MAG: tetratricopeptide repeat protein [Bacteroidota bacterium]
MRIKVLEIISIVLLIIGIVVEHLYYSDYGLFLLVGLIVSLLYAIGGYFIFKPTENIKFGSGIIITNSLLLSLIIFITTILISFSSSNRIYLFWIVYLPSLIVIALLIFILYRKNKTGEENRRFVKSVVIRNLCILVFCFLVGILPEYLRVTIFHGSNSLVYFKLKQRECIEKSDIYLTTEDYENAIAMASESIAYSYQRNDSTSSFYQKSLNALGYAYYMNGDYTKADSVYSKILMVNRDPDDSNEEYEHAIYNYGLLYSEMGDYDKSDSMLTLSLAAYKTNDLLLAYLHKVAATNQSERGNLLKADSLYKICLINHKNSGYRNKGNYISTLSSFANNYSDRALYSQADSVLTIALIEAEKEFGPQSIEYAEILDNMMLLYVTLADYVKAEKFGNKSLEIKKKLLGAEHSNYLYTLIQLTSIKMTRSEYENAKITLLHCLSVIEKKYSLKSPLACSVYDNLIDFYEDNEQLNDANHYADKSLESRIDYYGLFNINTATSIDSKAYLYYCDGKLHEADSLYYKALRIKKHYTGRNNPSFSKSLNGLGLVLTAQGNLFKADTVLTYARVILEECLGKDHPYYAQVLHNLGCLKTQQNQFRDAEEYLNESLHINTVHFGEIHLKVAVNYLGLAYLKKQTKNKPEALMYFKKSLFVYNTIFNATHPKVLLIKQEISLLEKN